MDELPVDVLGEIRKHLSFYERYRLRATNKFFAGLDPAIDTEVVATHPFLDHPLWRARHPVFTMFLRKRLDDVIPVAYPDWRLFAEGDQVILRVCPDDDEGSRRNDYIFGTLPTGQVSPTIRWVLRPSNKEIYQEQALCEIHFYLARANKEMTWSEFVYIIRTQNFYLEQ